MNYARMSLVSRRHMASIPLQLAPNTQKIYEKLIQGDRASLARAITLVESTLKTSKSESRYQEHFQSELRLSFLNHSQTTKIK